MDVLNPIAQQDVIIHNAKCTHCIPITARYTNTTNVVVFVDPLGKCYVWVTTTIPGFEVGKKYTIQGKLHVETARLRNVKILATDTATSKDISEQPDAQDVLLGLAEYNN